MPLQRRLPKFGFNSPVEKTMELRLNDLVKAGVDTVDLLSIKSERYCSTSVYETR